VVPAEVAVLIVRALKRDTVHKDGGRNSHPKSVDEQLKHIGLVRIASSRVSCSVEHRAPSALQIAVMLGTVETRLRACSLLDPPEHYTQPLRKHAADRLRHELETCTSTRDELQAALDARIAADATLRAELGQRKQQLKLLQSELDRRTQDLSSVLVELDWLRAGSIDVEPARMARERAIRALSTRRTSPERVAVSPARLSLTSPPRRTEAATPNASAFRHGLRESSKVTNVHASASPAGYDSDKELQEHLDRALQHAGRESWLRRMRGEARDNLGMTEAEAGQWEQSHSNAMARLQQEHAEAIDSYRRASSRWLHNRS
jgi:hypothetical protein